MDVLNTMPVPDALLRLPQIIGDKKTGRPGIIPVSRSTWWQGVQDGRFPKPVRISARCVAWRASEIAALVERLGQEMR